MPATVIAGRYELRDRIGGGAFGEVFEAYDQRLRRLVALKTLPIVSVADAEATEQLRRFHSEAQAVARLSHPGIVTVHDFGETPEFAWIAMELVIGETLKAVLDRGERPSLGETARIVGELLDALHYAHGRGIVHRDVKPANILLAISAAEGLGEVRLADFGVARVGEAQHTVLGQVVGTPIAMSPEQVRGEEVDLRADLWAVGVILHQMLTGERPFPGGIPAIFQNILTRDPRPPSRIVDGLPPRLDAVVARALAKNPRDRYASAAAMAAALRAAIAPAPELLAEAEAGTVVMAPPAPAAPMPSPAVAPPAPGRPPARRGLATAGIFAAGLLCGLALHRLPTEDVTRAAKAGAVAFMAELGHPTAIGGAQASSRQDFLAAKPPSTAPEPGDKAAIDATPAVPVALPPPLELPPEPPEPRRAEAPGPCDRERLAIRTGSHPGFGRLVFDWTAPVRHELEVADNVALLRFPEAGCLPAVGQLALPRNISAIRPDGAGTAIRIETAPATRLRAYRLEGNRVVMDVLDSAP